MRKWTYYAAWHMLGTNEITMQSEKISFLYLLQWQKNSLKIMSNIFFWGKMQSNTLNTIINFLKEYFVNFLLQIPLQLLRDNE